MTEPGPEVTCTENFVCKA